MISQSYTTRPYQAEAIQRIFAELETNRRTLAVMATGLGKTVTFAQLIAQWPEAQRVLVLAHRDELIQQAAAKIEQITGEAPDIEQAGYFADQRSMLDRCRVIVSSVQTLCRPHRHERFHPEEFGLVVIDEAHHAVSPTYQRILQYFGQNEELRVLGVTATPDRADELALGRIFESVAFDYGIVNGIDDGWLVPIQQQFVQVGGLDLAHIRTTAGDLNQGELAKVLEAEEILHGFAWPILQEAGNRQTVVFTATVEQAERLSEILNRHKPGKSAWLSGDQVQFPRDRRRELLRAFSDRRLQYLVNCGVLTEGFDAPCIEVVAVARPTKSRSLYTQIVGRGTRTLPGLVDGIPEAEARRAAIAASLKPFVLVLDFVGNSGKHKLCHCGDILGGDFDTEILLDLVERSKKTGEPTDLLKKLRDEYAAREARKAEEARRRAEVKAKSEYRRQAVDPFSAWHIMPKREPGWHKGRKPTEAMAAVLSKMGVNADKLSFWEAKQVLDEAGKRREKGLCTYKQSKILASYGLSTEVGFKEASATIDRIAANRWKLPADMVAGAPQV